jgi:hypothetical protein
VLVPSYEAVLLRDKGWKEMYSQEALWQLDRAMDPWWPGQLRSFVAAIDLHGSMSDTPDSRLLDIVRLAIENGSLVGLRKIDGAAKPLDETEERRRLIKKIDQLTRNKLNYAGRQYGLVVDIELAIVPGRNSYEVVSQADARRVLDGLAKQAGTSEDLATLLGQASAKLTADWRQPFTEPDGLILLRRIVERAVARRNDEPAITPSQMRALMKSDWIEIEVVDEEGKPVEALCCLELPDGTKVEDHSDAEGLLARYNIDPGTCSLSFRRPGR